MKNYLLFLSLLILVSATHAQPDTSVSRKVVGKVGNTDATEFYIRLNQKEKELAKLRDQYVQARRGEKSSIKARMLATLYELFDLSMIKKYSEAEQFRSLLQQMESLQAYRDKNQEIDSLQHKLELVERQIAEREKLRDEIVARRLEQILQEP